MNIATEENEVIEDDIESVLEGESEADAKENQPSEPAVGITDAEFSQAEHDHYEAIKRANTEVQIAQREYDRANGIAKAAKKELELASLELSTLISDGPQIPTQPSPQMELPFADPDAPDPDAWKSVPVEDVLTLTESQKDKLFAADITTLGRLEFVRGGGDPDFPRGLRSIKGFGEKTIEAMENDVVEWLSKNVRQPEDES